MNATPLPFISRIYFLFTTSPETLTAASPAFAASSANFTGHFSRMAVAQMSPVRRTSGSHRAAFRMQSARRGHEDVQRLTRQNFFLAQISQRGKFAARGLGVTRAPLPRVDLGHFVIRQRVLRIEFRCPLEVRQCARGIVLLHVDFAA